MLNRKLRRPIVGLAACVLVGSAFVASPASAAPVAGIDPVVRPLRPRHQDRRTVRRERRRLLHRQRGQGSRQRHRRRDRGLGQGRRGHAPLRGAQWRRTGRRRRRAQGRPDDPRHRVRRRPGQQPGRGHRGQHGHRRQARRGAGHRRQARRQGPHRVHARHAHAPRSPAATRSTPAARRCSLGFNVRSGSHVLLPDRRPLHQHRLDVDQRLRHARHPGRHQLPGQRLRHRPLHQHDHHQVRRGRLAGHHLGRHPRRRRDGLPPRLHDRHPLGPGHRAEQHGQLRRGLASPA